MFAQHSKKMGSRKIKRIPRPGKDIVDIAWHLLGTLFWGTRTPHWLHMDVPNSFNFIILKKAIRLSQNFHSTTVTNRCIHEVVMCCSHAPMVSCRLLSPAAVP